MPVTAISARSGRLAAHATDSGRVAPIRRSPAEAAALTVTVSIPLTGDALTPQAHRLIEAVRELAEMNHGSVTVVPAEPVAAPLPDGGEQPDPEVRLLASTRQVVVDGRPLPLTRLEFDLLMYLAENPRRVFTRAQLLTGVWGYEHTGERTVDVHVRRLRVKLGGQLPLITTVYGVGYRLSDNAHLKILPHD
jgi:hypothetical protein